MLADLWNQLIVQTSTLIRDNQFLSGGMVLGMIAGILALLRRVPGQAYSWVRRRIVIELQIESDDPAFCWLQLLIAKNEWSQRSRRWLAVTMEGGRRAGNYQVATLAPTASNPPSAVDSQTTPEVLMLPAPGLHILRHDRRWFWFHYTRTQRKLDELLLGFHESMTLFSFGRDPKVFLRLIDEAHTLALPENPKAIALYVLSWGSWQKLKWLDPRPISSVVLDDGIGEFLLADIQKFLSERQWYHDLGIPWRRGYLLYGPPGNGKTSLAIAIASELGKSVYSFSIGKGISDDGFRGRLMDVPEEAVVLIEDVEQAYVEVAPGQESVTRSGFLNALDGAASKEGRILFMTTNREPASLDPALIRAGRADIVQHLDSATLGQARRIFLRFHPGRDDEAQRFAECVTQGMNMATLQGVLLAARNEPRLAIEKLRSEVETTAAAGM